MPHVYLIQPCELVGTNRYKIGMSSLNNLSRLKSYKNGSRYICFFECENALAVEKELIRQFNDRYKRIAGNEYFESNNEADMVQLFMDIVLNYKSIEHQRSVNTWMERFAYKCKIEE